MYAIFIFLTALLAACNPTTNSNITPNKTYRPISTESCEQFSHNTAVVLNVETSTKIGPFKDFVTGEETKACIIQAKGTGVNFTSPIDVMRLLRAALFSAWTETPAYQADGPIGTITAFRDDKRLAVVSAHWDPAPEANCPKDQVISACPVTPEQKLYTITIQAVQK